MQEKLFLIILGIIIGVVLGMFLGFYSENIKSILNIETIKGYFDIKWLRKFLKGKETIKERNISRLNTILILIFIAYMATALIVITLGMSIHTVIGLIFFVLVVILGCLTGIGLLLVQDNYEEENGCPEMMSLGESLITFGLQLLIGTMAIGAITLVITIASGK